ncbi:unnamed protein product [Protopolystoma xenopodis]|uniref:Uncharacterized protein n=1 Tax=Protopolystoma xenopodis TaxID=117903 RepID=A0A3S4ZXR5_9PLAT|nr:unnamed protein product [Protopolystoma xenopodis]
MLRLNGNPNNIQTALVLNPTSGIDEFLGHFWHSQFTGSREQVSGRLDSIGVSEVRSDSGSIMSLGEKDGSSPTTSDLCRMKLEGRKQAERVAHPHSERIPPPVE